MSESLREAARNALAAHDALREARALEPECGEDGMPLNPRAWLFWHESVSQPAYAEWDAAMDALADAVGDPSMSRHPFNFRPMCEEILTRV